MEIQDYAIIIGFTSILSTASTTVIVVNRTSALKKELCDKMSNTKKEITEDLVSLFVRVGILESKHQP